MAPDRCCAGWSRTSASRRTCRSGTELNARMARYRVASSFWDEQANQYRCPEGHALLSDRRRFTKPRDRITKDGTIVYRANQHDCSGCAMKQRCCPNMTHRKITRSVHERSRDVAREIASTPQYKQSRRDRKKVEMLFAHLKRILKLDRLRLRGLS